MSAVFTKLPQEQWLKKRNLRIYWNTAHNQTSYNPLHLKAVSSVCLCYSSDLRLMQHITPHLILNLPTNSTQQSKS
jgi:hypothetical protein